jgi:hypothetical protein
MSITMNKNIVEVLELTQTMINLADRGDNQREDANCGVLFGMLRDTAFHLRRLAVKERENHISSGIWEIDNE